MAHVVDSNRVRTGAAVSDISDHSRSVHSTSSARYPQKRDHRPARASIGASRGSLHGTHPMVINILWGTTYLSSQSPRSHRDPRHLHFDRRPRCPHYSDVTVHISLQSSHRGLAASHSVQSSSCLLFVESIFPLAITSLSKETRNLLLAVRLFSSMSKTAHGSDMVNTDH